MNSFYLIMYVVKCMVILAVMRSTEAFEGTKHDSGKMQEEKQPKCSLLSYSSTCFKLDLLRLMILLGKMPRISVTPGITLLSTEKTKRLANELELAAQSISRSDVNKFLWDAAVKYFSSLNLTMRLDQANLFYDIKSFSEDVWSGRGRRGWYAIGALAIVAFGVLSTLVGKALMASVLALFISGIQTMRGMGMMSPADSPSAYGKITQYDIYTKPYFSGPYHDHDHHHYSALSDAYFSERGISRAIKKKENNIS